MKMIFKTCTLLLALGVSACFADSGGGQRNVAIVIYDGVEILDFAGPSEVFASTTVAGKHVFNVYTVAETADPLLSQGFVTVKPEYTIANCPKPDVIVLPGGGTSKPLSNPDFVAWIKKVAPDLDVALSVCTGAFLLEKAGLLDGKKATTWHGAINRLRQIAKNTEVLENTRFVDNGKVVTTAGVSAGIDGSLHVVSRFCGEDVARATARYMEYDKWVPDAGTIVENPTLSALLTGNYEPENTESTAAVFEGDLRNLAQELVQKGHPEAALKILQFAVKTIPESWLAERDLAVLLKERGQTGEAKTHFANHLRSNQNDLAAIDALGFDEAMTILRKAAAAKQLNQGSVNQLGYMLMNRQDFDSAVKVFQLNTATFPDSWNAYDSLAEAYMNAGKNNLALKNYRKSLELNPDNKNATAMIEKLGGTN